MSSLATAIKLDGLYVNIHISLGTCPEGGFDGCIVER